MNGEKLLSTSQIAAMCGVTTVTVQRWVKEGCFPGARKGLGKTSPYRIPQGEVEAFITRVAEGRQKEWLEQQAQARAQGQDRAQEATPPSRTSRPSQRAVVAALTELLQEFGERRVDKAFALVVEDDPDAGAIFEFTLKAAGFATSVVKSGNTALNWLASMIPDVVVLDLHLPDVPGIEVLRRMRANPRLAKVPVIVATAHPELAEDLQEEATLVLIKPVRYSLLHDKAIELVEAQ